MFLPSLTVALALAPVVIRSLRASMLNVLGAEYVTTARSKGVAGHRLFLRHVLRNAVIPAVTVLGINIGFLIGGTVIIENVFAIPGLGQLMINSIFERDFTGGPGRHAGLRHHGHPAQPVGRRRLRGPRPESAVLPVSAIPLTPEPGASRLAGRARRRGPSAASRARPGAGTPSPR